MSVIDGFLPPRSLHPFRKSKRPSYWFDSDMVVFQPCDTHQTLNKHQMSVQVERTGGQRWLRKLSGPNRKLWLRQVGRGRRCSGTARSPWRSHLPQGAAFREVVGDRAARIWAVCPGPGLQNRNFALYPVKSGYLCFWAEEWQDWASIFRKFCELSTKGMNGREPKPEAGYS